MKLLVATRNKGKLKEIERLLSELDIQVVGLETFPQLPEVLEDGETFEANAIKKAETVARLTGLVTLADDSGLAVDALGGRPGVYSARYAGENASDVDNNRKLLADLQGVPSERRQGAFHCAMALARKGEKTLVFQGKVDGIILEAARGEGGFGYDPLFLVREFGRTMAELSIETKNRISHRGQALQQLVDYLRR